MKAIVFLLGTAFLAGGGMVSNTTSHLQNSIETSETTDLVLAQMKTTAAMPQVKITGVDDRAIITDDLVTSIPDGFRYWTFLGSPVTPNGLNGGEAPFPEFHNVYIHPDFLNAYLETGVFPEGTTFVKELVLTQDGEFEDGSRTEVSGRGYFAKSFHGIDMMVKDSVKFAETGGWGFYNFGHHAPPYEASAKAAPIEACASCHIDNATTELVFSKFYPILER